MPWTLQDFRTRPTRLVLKPQISVNGFAANNAPYNEVVNVMGDNYTIVDFGRESSGTAVVEALAPPNQVRVTCTKGDGGNAYLLPWYADKICMCELGQAHDYFFTVTVNSCAIMVSGGLCNPFVVHANTQSNQLDPMLPAAQLALQFQGIYGGMSAALARRGMVDTDNVRIFQPGDYMGFGTVFGIRNDSRWTFYSTAWTQNGAVTQQLWP